MIENRAAALAFAPPSKMSQLKSYLIGMLPYHRQAWPAGTLFNSVLQEPLKTPDPGRIKAKTDSPAPASIEPQELAARLLSPISSATAREGVEADFGAHLALDSEGSAHVASPKTRFIFPAIAAAVAGLSFHQDYNAKGVPDADSAGRAESGAVGLGLVGTALAQISRPVASGIAITGAAFSIYSTFIARGANVIFPLNTPLRISLEPRGGEATVRQPAK